MTIQTVNGETIDTDSPEYQRFLRLSQWDKSSPDVSDPAPYRTLGDVIELERRHREREAQTTDTISEIKEARAATGNGITDR